MTNEIQVGAAVLTGAETLIATLTAWHPFVDVYVDGTSDPRVLGSHWNLYAVTPLTRTRIASGVFDTPAPIEGQRVLSAVPGEGTTIELRAFTPNGTTPGAITAAIVGWDPSTATVNPDDAADAAISLVPGPEIVIAALVWHPEISVYVQGTEQALGSFWRVRAVIAGLASNVPVASGVFQDVQASRVVVRTGGGADSWQLTASAPAGPTGILTASIFGKTEFDLGTIGGVANVTASLPLTSSGGANPNIAILFPISDALFSVGAAANPTKIFRFNLSGQAAATATTFFTTGTVARAFRTPDISGTAVVQEDATDFVFLGPGVTAPLHGSSARVQLSSLIANGPQFRGNQYGANAGVPGLSTFKSRGLTIGSLAGCIAGDILGGITAVGVAPDNVSIPLAALIRVQVPTSFVPVAQNWLPSEYELQLVPLAGPINGRRISFKVGSEGDSQTLRGSRAGGPATAATFAGLAAGALRSSSAGAPNGTIVGSPGDLYTDTAGGAGVTLWIKESGVATTTGWIAAGTTGGSGSRSILIWGNGSVTPTTTTRFLAPGNDSGMAPVLASIVQFRALFAGTLRNLRVRHNQPSGNGNAIVYTLRVNGGATALSVALASTGSDASDLADVIPIAVGDLIDIAVTKALGVAASPSGIIADLELRAA